MKEIDAPRTCAAVNDAIFPEMAAIRKRSTQPLSMSAMIAEGAYHTLLAGFPPGSM